MDRDIFIKYQHIERYGTDEVDGIQSGMCHIFPKLDGTNAQCYMGNNELKFGSSKRLLSLDFDNAGFMAQMLKDERIKAFFNDYPDLRLFGEFLVPHSLRTYKEDAWREFYIFDVIELKFEGETPIPRYLEYEEYLAITSKYGLKCIPPIAIKDDPDEDFFNRCIEKNTYLIREDKGVGEGIVIKNYSFINKYGRKTWAKIVTKEFKEKHRLKRSSTDIIKPDVHNAIIDKLLTREMILKTYEKVRQMNGSFTSKNTFQLLNTVYHDFIVEESWNIVKKFKNPTIDYHKLQGLVFDKVKEYCL